MMMMNMIHKYDINDDDHNDDANYDDDDNADDDGEYPSIYQ